MKKYRAFFVLFLILIFPILIYVFIKAFGTQNYRPIETISEKIPNPDGSLDSVFKAVGDFSFASHRGDTLRMDSLKGKIWLANVFHGNCSDACDIENAYIKQLLTKDFPTDPDIRIISFSVDPANDSVPVLKAYAEKLEADRRWYFLTGNPAVLSKFLIEELKFLPTDPKALSEKGLTDRTFRVVDWDGHLRGSIYHSAAENEMVTMAQHMVFLQKELADMRSGAHSPQ